MPPSSPTLPLAPVAERHPVTGSWSRVALGVAAAVAGGAAVALLYAVAVLDRTGRWFDNGLMRAAMAAGSAVRTELRLVLEVAAPTAMVVVAVLVVLAWRRGLRGRAVAAAVVVLGSQLVTQALKAGLPAPHSDGNSLPSGHVTVAVTTAVALWLLVPRLVPALRVLAVPVVALVGVATMIVGWHRPSDVLAAGAVVLMVGGLTVAVSAVPGVADRLSGRDHGRRTESDGLGSRG